MAMNEAFLVPGIRRSNADAPLFDGPSLFREQRELLERTAANEIRNSVFLSMRRSAQLKRTVQSNQLAEHRALRRRPSPAAVPINNAIAAVEKTEKIVHTVPPQMFSLRSGDGDAEDGATHHCPGCGRRYTELSAFALHQSRCKEYAAVLRRNSTEMVPLSARPTGVPPGAAAHPLSQSGSPALHSTWNAELRATCQRLDSTAHGLGRAEQAVARNSGLSSDPQALSQSHGWNGVVGNLGLVSPSREYSSSPEDRRSAFSSTPASVGPRATLQQSIGGNALDDVPASAAARRVSTESAPRLSNNTNNYYNNDEKEEEDDDAVANVPTTAKPNFGTAAAAEEAHDGTEEPLRPCPHCGRHFFANSRWPRHVAVCERRAPPPQQQQQQQNIQMSPSGLLTSRRHTAAATAPRAGGKRRVYDARARRLSQIYGDEKIPDNTDAPLPSGRRSRGNGSGEDAADAKQSKWRQQRAQLRRALHLEGSGDRQGSNGRDGDEDFVDDRVQCPACGRRFAQASAERHIPFCKERLGVQKVMRR